MAVAGLVVMGEPEALSAIAASLRSSAEAVSEAAKAGAVIIGAGANVSAQLAYASRRALSSSSSFVGEVWEGVDIVDLRAERVAVRAVARSRDELRLHWRAEKEASALPQGAGDVLDQCAAGEASGHEMGIKRFRANESWLEIACRTRELLSGQIGQAAWIQAATFNLQWANPLWEMLMLDPSMQRSQVMAKLREVFTGMDPMPDNVTDVSEGSFLVLAAPSRPALWLQALVGGLEGATAAIDWLAHYGAAAALAFAALWMTCKAEGLWEAADGADAGGGDVISVTAASAVPGASVARTENSDWQEVAENARH